MYRLSEECEVRKQSKQKAVTEVDAQFKEMEIMHNAILKLREENNTYYNDKWYPFMKNAYKSIQQTLALVDQHGDHVTLSGMS